MAFNSNFSSLTGAFSNDLKRAQDTWNSGTRLRFINEALSMIGEQLRSHANEGFITLTADPTRTNIYFLPEDFVEMRFVEQVNGNFIQQIAPLGIQAAHRFKTLASQSVGYLVYSDTETESTHGQTTNQSGQMVLQLIPGNEQDISIDYWQQPTQFPSSGSGNLTNPVLQAHFNLCLWGTEISAWQDVQNWEQRDRVQQLFDAEMQRINMAANNARYGAGAARNAPARFYNTTPTRAM